MNLNSKETLIEVLSQINLKSTVKLDDDFYFVESNEVSLNAVPIKNVLEQVQNPDRLLRIITPTIPREVRRLNHAHSFLRHLHEEDFNILKITPGTGALENKPFIVKDGLFKSHQFTLTLHRAAYHIELELQNKSRISFNLHIKNIAYHFCYDSAPENYPQNKRVKLAEAAYDLHQSLTRSSSSP